MNTPDNSHSWRIDEDLVHDREQAHALFDDSVYAQDSGIAPGDRGEFDESRDTEYTILDKPELRVEYITLTDELVRRMAEQGTEVAVFLDKSARPVAWMVNEMWDTLAPADENGEKPPKPQIKFANIDREGWRQTLGSSETGAIALDAFTGPYVNSLRKVFSEPGAEFDEDEKAPYAGPTMFDGKKVMVIDEVSVSGDTLDMAKGMIRKSFPEAAEVEGAYWMPGRVRQTPGGTYINTRLPVWYSKEHNTGRLIANKNSNVSAESNSARQRVGAIWLGVPWGKFGVQDLKGIKLKREVHQMAEDLANHRILYRPSVSWGTELARKRIEQINDIPIQDYVNLRQWAGDDVARFNQLYVDAATAKQS